MMQKLNISLLVAAILLMLLVILQFVVIGFYSDTFKENKQTIEWWHNKYDSLLDKNCELHEKVYKLQDSIITLKYKED